MKAQSRQTKLLNVALNKAKHHKTDLRNLNVTLDQQKFQIQKNSVEIPSLMYSPFLPLVDQLKAPLHFQTGDDFER